MLHVTNQISTKIITNIPFLILILNELIFSNIDWGNGNHMHIIICEYIETRKYTTYKRTIMSKGGFNKVSKQSY